MEIDWCIKKIRFFSSSHSTIKLCHQSSVPLVSHPTKFVSYPSKVSVHVNLLLAKGVILSKFHKQLSAFLKKAVSNKLNSLFIFLEIVKVFIIKTSTPFQMQSVIGVNVLQCPQTKSSWRINQSVCGLPAVCMKRYRICWQPFSGSINH